MSLATEVRWRGKILAKIALSRLPVSYDTWRRIGIFRHGHMRSGEYTLKVFERAIEHAGLDDVHGLRVMELGPGDSLFSAVLANAAGAASSVHVDVGEFVDQDVDHYRDFAEMLRNRGYEPISFSSARTVEDVLERCHARYLTRGVASMRRLPSASVDFTWSQSTIEHVRAGELPAMADELRRVMADDGVAVHHIDLRDHLADGLNSLRFSARAWESPVMANSGFYTNRVRFPALLDLFARAGFRTDVTSVGRWPMLPTPRARMAPEFRDLSDDELRVAAFAVRLTPR